MRIEKIIIKKTQTNANNGQTQTLTNVTERIITVQGQFMVIQGSSFLYQSKARIRLPISDQ